MQNSKFLLLVVLLLSVVLMTLASSGNKKQQNNSCRYAEKYSMEDLLASESIRQQFLLEMAHWEGKFSVNGVGLNSKTGLTYDGHGIDYETGELHAPAHAFSAASKECIHAGLLALALKGNPVASTFFKSAMVSDNDPSKSLDEYVVNMLTRKIEAYERWNKKYPGFGGYLPWYTVSDEGMGLLWDWKDRIPSLDNGELIWSLIAVAQAAQDSGYEKLANRYWAQVKLMAETSVIMFYQGKGRISCVIQIKNITANPTRDNYVDWTGPSGDHCYLDDPYEGELMAFFMDLYGDWRSSSYTAAERDQIWVAKRAKLQKASFTTKHHGSIDVERGWWFSSHEMWKYMIMPYLDVSITRRVFLNGERARVHFSREQGYGGLFASVTNVSVPGNYEPNYVSATGIQEIAFQRVATNQIATPYGAYPLLISPETRGIGLAWYVSMLKGSKMQGPYGSTEAVSIDGKYISPVITWDTKITSVLAASGGIGDLTRSVMLKHGHYTRFVEIIEREWGKVFSDLRGEDVPFVTPRANIPNILPEFTKC